jgi:uncharacterized glyoxalase superfamily protein PhnB
MTTSTSSDRTDSTAAGSRPAPTVWPSVGFRDVDAGITFLTDGLGFVVTACYRGADGAVEHAEARWPDGGGVMFGSRGKPGDWGALGPAGVYVVAADTATVDAAFDRVRGLAGVEVLRELHDTDYGSHEFGVRDADGNLWTLGTYRGA